MVRGAGGSGSSTRVYIPTIVYTVGATQYEKDGQGVTKGDFYHEGEEVEVHYRVEKPDKFICVSLDEGKNAFPLFLYAALGLIALGLVSAVLK